MSALIPVHAANSIRDGINEYLTTSFALADADTAVALKEFFSDPDTGMFHGPYVRARLPYARAKSWKDILEWLPGAFVPYHHQAEAFRRLRTRAESRHREPEPTIVITGTGSGKTESFLMPILNHARAARAAGERGIKALIMYPMNALANDQADRLAKLIWDNEFLHGVTAGIYTGESTTNRTTMSREHLITDRNEIRRNPPDILLTNYKMLDQLLLRPIDREIWEHSATSLQYLVLDEFHTYDGAQGTDVALLLRRLGLMLKKYQPQGFLSTEQEDWALGKVTPVATSATLGAKGENEPILAFAETVFGRPFPTDAVVTETMLTVDQWRDEMAETLKKAENSENPDKPVADRGMPSVSDIEEILRELEDTESSRNYADEVLQVFCERVWGCPDDARLEQIIVDYSSHELTARILEHAASATPLIRREQDEVPTLPDLVLGDDARRLGETKSVRFITHALTAMSLIRARRGESDPREGKRLPGVEAHLWLRELSRIERAISASADEHVFRWSDDGLLQDSSFERPGHLPACYCRSCGRSGWMVSLEPGTDSVVFDAAQIRGNSINNPDRTRPLIDATPEHLRAVSEGRPVAGPRSEGDSSIVAWLDSESEQLTTSEPGEAAVDQRLAIPVLTHWGGDAGKAARDEQCPSCGESDSIRYIGASLATLLSVSLSNLFGMPGLDDSEKKTLVFTDSVQDAAHRAGFVQARSRTFALRTQIRSAVGEFGFLLDEVPRELIDQAGNDDRARYQLLPPEVADYPAYRNYWDSDVSMRVRQKAERQVRDRLAFDLVLEFGQRADLARSLVSTGSLTVAVNVPDGIAGTAAKEAIAEIAQQNLKGQTPKSLRAWVRGILEMIRIRGGINHPWFAEYLRDDGNAYLLNRRQSRARGVPAFPKGGSPEFPRVGSPLSDTKRDYGVSAAGSPRGRYARWTAKMLGIPANDAAHAVTRLLRELAKLEFLTSRNTNTGAVIYAINSANIELAVEADPHILECDICRARTGVFEGVRAELEGAPCFTPSCQGTLTIVPVPDNYYRRLYAATTPRTVIAREHTGLLTKETRRDLEGAFRGDEGAQEPNAPNVLVATPTLEMGIDIGDLSTAMLSSLPKTVASYTQRVGRAGRLTGNSLALALARGRGETLPKINAPLSVISGKIVPPSAFLSAVEILQRQLLAYVVDSLPLEQMASLRTARDVFDVGTSSPKLVDILLAELESGIGDLVEEFIATVGNDVDATTLDDLRAWANGTASPNLRENLLTARDEWTSERSNILDRVRALDAQVQQFDLSSDSGDDDIKMERRQVRSALKHERSRSANLTDEHWVSAMEAHGLLPNFTLLDDAVELSVHVSTLDPQTLDFNTEAYEYSRGISSALQELAPGSTFYAQGIAAVIDSVEIGQAGEAVIQWRVCSQCSYSEVETDTPSNPCPVCHDPHFADIGAVIDVLPLKKVAAEVEQTRAAISDSQDDRASRMFNLQMTFVAVDDGGSTWYTRDGFGAKFMPRVDLRWLNLGKGEGQERRFGGRAFSAPLFRVCESCGHVDNEAGSNSMWDHRPWCPRRHAHEEKTVTFALGRTLRTQGVLLYLPERLSTNVDKLAVPSLIAAIRLGFREVLGGDPDHLAVNSVRVMGNHGPMDALLVSDSVPGGTGYLYQFVKPSDVFRLLKAGLNVVESCECQHDDRLSCPECLLPFSGWKVNSTSREAAEVALRSILLEKRNPDPDEAITASNWTEVTSERPAAAQGSELEIRFRHMLLSQLENQPNVVVRQTMSGGFNQWTFEMPGGTRWQMREQHRFKFTVPDFYFEPLNRDVRPIAVFLDGAAYHASSANDRVDSDVSKRRRLYDEGILPFSITSYDLDRFADPDLRAPVWHGGPKGAAFLRKIGMLSAAEQVLLTSSPFKILMEVLDRPDSPSWNMMRHAAAVVAMAQVTPQRDGDFVMVSTHADRLRAWISFVDSQPRTRRLLLETNRDSVPDQETWNDFLNLANLYWLSDEAVEVHTSSTLEAAGQTASPAEEFIESATDEWTAIFEELDGDGVDDALTVLRDSKIMVADQVGEEISGLPAVLIWPTRKVAMLYDDQTQEEPVAVQLENDGWTLFAAEGLRPESVPAKLFEETSR